MLRKLHEMEMILQDAPVTPPVRLMLERGTHALKRLMRRSVDHPGFESPTLARRRDHVGAPKRPVEQLVHDDRETHGYIGPLLHPVLADLQRFPTDRSPGNGTKSLGQVEVRRAPVYRKNVREVDGNLASILVGPRIRLDHVRVPGVPAQHGKQRSIRRPMERLVPQILIQLHLKKLDGNGPQVHAEIMRYIPSRGTCVFVEEQGATVHGDSRRAVPSEHPFLAEAQFYNLSYHRILLVEEDPRRTIGRHHRDGDPTTHLRAFDRKLYQATAGIHAEAAVMSPDREDRLTLRVHGKIIDLHLLIQQLISTEEVQAFGLDARRMSDESRRLAEPMNLITCDGMICAGSSFQQLPDIVNRRTRVAVRRPLSDPAHETSPCSRLARRPMKALRPSQTKMP